MTDVFHHLHKRKRIHQHKEQYPHPHPHKRMVDKLVYVVGVITPLLTAQQAYMIFSTQVATGVSIVTFGGFILNNIIWLWYGWLHKEKPLIFMYSLLFIFNTLVVTGILMYG